MLTKLLSLLSTVKGAAAAGVIAAAGAGGGVAATNADVQHGLNTAVQNVTQAITNASPSASGQPAVVGARNDADKKLRDAFQDDQQKLEKLRSTSVAPADRAALEKTINDADAALRARLQKALDDVAALTLGRNGLQSPKPSGSPDVKASFGVTEQAAVDAIVTAAVADMDQIASDAEGAVGALPTFQPGKPAEAGKPADAGQPADVQGGKPSQLPTPPPHP